MFAGNCKTGLKLFWTWFWFHSFSNNVFIPDTYFMDEMIEYLVFEDCTKTFNCFKMYSPLLCSEFHCRHITSVKSYST